MFQKGCELMSRERKFPLVDDNDVVVAVPKTMRLYENEDLITNIHGPYEDKVYNDVTQDYQFIPDNPNPQKVASDRLVTQKAGKTYAELAREEARADLKKKRSASYLTSDVVPKKHRSTLGLSPRKSTTTKVQPTAFFQKENPGEFAKYAQHLKQEDYIVVDLPANNVVSEEAPVVEKKNNYDFLKTSQVYNNQEIQEKKEHTVATELNLTHFDQV